MIPQLKDNDKLFKIHKYPDGTSYVELFCTNETDISFTFRINDYKDLWQLAQVCEVLYYNDIRALIHIPCILDGQADRRFVENQSSGLKLVMNFLNKLCTTEGHDIGFEIFHPHNPEVVESLLKSGQVKDNSIFIDKVLDKLAPIDNIDVLSPDAGSFKWISKVLDKVGFDGGLYMAGKNRVWKDGTSILTQVVEKQDFQGRDILILDDICIYGGTFKGLAKLLRERNVGELYLAVSHMTIQNHKGKDTVFDYFDRVFTTNSKYDHYWVETFGGQPKQPDNLEVIKLF